MHSAPRRVSRPGSPGPAPTRYTVPFSRITNQDRIVFAARIIGRRMVCIVLEAAALLALKRRSRNEIGDLGHVTVLVQIGVRPLLRRYHIGDMGKKGGRLRGRAQVRIVSNYSDLVVHDRPNL